MSSRADKTPKKKAAEVCGVSRFSRASAGDYQQRRKKSARRSIAKRALLTTLLSVVVMAIAAAALWMVSVQTRLNNPRVINNDLRSSLKEQPVNSDPYYVLLLGTDGRPGETEYRADSIILARVDPAQKRVTLLSIPRDTYVTWKGSQMKINAVHFYDGAAGMVQIVNELCGVKISHYAEVNFDGLAGITNAVGGVTVDVDQYMRDTENFSGVTELYAGRQTLNGEQALFYTRCRYAFADSDYTRMRHQRTFIKALLSQVLSSGDPVKIASIINSVADMVVTDLSVSDAISLASQMVGLNAESGIYTAYVPSTPETIGDQSYVIADDDALAEMMKLIDQGKDPSKLNDKTDAEADKEAGEGESSSEEETQKTHSERSTSTEHTDNPVTVNSEDILQ
ncbi:LCP family protein [Lancefieldella rimae]|uniref:LCP family protein n=1 Tax=Lancefieldella rimae TaxID=1383 RepID=A0A930YP47_9ACTN|nr:LCP family protein [Lancefieldella rimae]